MNSVSLGAVAVSHLVAGVAFALVGNKLRKRAVEARNRLAQVGTIVWWWGLAAYMVMQAGLLLLAVLGDLSVSTVTTSRLVSGPLLSAACWGLSVQILYLRFGRRWPSIPLGLYYAATAVAYDYSTAMGGPYTLQPNAWGLGVEPQLEGTLWTLVLASIGLPPILGSFALVRMARHLEDRLHRLRMQMVGSGILVWVGAGFLGQVAGGAVAKFLTLVVLGIAAAAIVFVAYFPPAWIERRLAAEGPSQSPDAPKPL